jgi:hypothetical protein
MTPRETEAHLVLLRHILSETKAKHVLWSYRRTKEADVDPTSGGVIAAEHEFTAKFTSGHTVTLNYDAALWLEWKSPPDWSMVIYLTDELYDVAISIIEEILRLLPDVEFKTDQCEMLKHVESFREMLDQQYLDSGKMRAVLPTSVEHLIKLHGEGIKIISDVPQIRGVEIWSEVRPLKEGNFHGELWRKIDNASTGRDVGVHTLPKEWANKPIWRRYNVAELVKER